MRANEHSRGKGIYFLLEVTRSIVKAVCVPVTIRQPKPVAHTAIERCRPKHLELCEAMRLTFLLLVFRRQVKAAVDCIYRMSRNGSVDDISDVVQDFFENMYHRFNEHPLYKGGRAFETRFLAQTRSNRQGALKAPDYPLKALE